VTDLLVVEGLTKDYRRGRGVAHAVADVSFTVERGEILALVGESGCGKTTTARTILRLTEPTAGAVHFDGVNVLALGPVPLRRLRRRMQLVFQDAAAALNPRLSVGVAIREGLTIHAIAEGAEADARVRRVLDEVGLGAAFASRYPHECSGGQRQRVGIARALAVEPDFLVCDEPVSALDMSVQAQIIALLQELQRARGLTYLFIAHDLGLVAQIATRIAVMQLGRVVEIGAAADVIGHPATPYTRDLLSAVPTLDPGARRRRSELPRHG
jgi:ABC-type oligopeptide transport system ATPase subunit